jgi:hypothetical protein
MADTADRTETEAQTAAKAELDESLAGRSHAEIQQVTVTLAEHIDDGTLDHAQIVNAVHDAEVVAQDTTLAHEHQHEQAVLAEHGQFDAAKEEGSKAAYELQDAEGHGGAAAHPTIDAQSAKQGSEVAALGTAGWEASIAIDDAHSAAAYAASGDSHGADQYGHDADTHASTAADAGHQGDHGGSHATSPEAETSGETTAE